MFFYSIFTSGLSISSAVMVALAFLGAALLSIVIHEVSHGYIAMKCGDLTAKYNGRLTLNPAKHFDLIGLLMMLLIGFGWAKPVPINPNNFKNYKKGMLAVSSAGIISNLLLSALSIAILAIFKSVGLTTLQTGATAVGVFITFIIYFFIYLAIVNVMLACFNLLPIYPLDGFRILDAVLPYGNAYSRFMRNYGMYVLLGFIVLSSLFRMVGLPYLNVFGLIASAMQRLVWLVLF